MSEFVACLPGGGPNDCCPGLICIKAPFEPVGNCYKTQPTTTTTTTTPLPPSPPPPPPPTYTPDSDPPPQISCISEFAACTPGGGATDCCPGLTCIKAPFEPVGNCRRNQPTTTTPPPPPPMTTPPPVTTSTPPPQLSCISEFAACTPGGGATDCCPGLTCLKAEFEPVGNCVKSRPTPVPQPTTTPPPKSCPRKKRTD